MTLSRNSAEQLSWALTKLKSRFTGKSESWVRRCLKRLRDVEEIEVGTWRVKGRFELGDRYPNYLVKVVNGKYQCSCHDPHKPYSRFRRRSVCSHIGAVILYRALRKLR
ncbi:MAG: hypothetical protein DRJ98_03975 [Thermoprotei archaeon]|nr:MAG: hypothetical protein DRJ98_03975 [Thermoprotei archaeon]